MSDTETAIYLSGDSFFPSALLKIIPEIKIQAVTEPGEILKRGKYIHKPSPYGCCRILSPINIEVGKKIEWMADCISDNIKAFKKSGASKIVPWIYWKGVQGNMEFTPVELKKLSDLGLGVCVDYIQEIEGE